MPRLNVYKSEKRKDSNAQTIYLGGLIVFRNKWGIRISYKGDIAHCPKNSNVYKFFDKILKKSAGVKVQENANPEKNDVASSETIKI